MSQLTCQTLVTPVVIVIMTELTHVYVQAPETQAMVIHIIGDTNASVQYIVLYLILSPC